MPSTFFCPVVLRMGQAVFMGLDPAWMIIVDMVHVCNRNRLAHKRRLRFKLPSNAGQPDQAGPQQEHGCRLRNRSRLCVVRIGRECIDIIT